MNPGEYESIRLKNLEDNKRVLAAFGLMNPFKPTKCIVKRTHRPAAKTSSSAKKRPLPQEDLLLTGSLYGTRRKSARLDGKVAGEGLDFGSTYEELDEAEKQVTRTPTDRPNFYGPIPGVDVGTEWATRMECSRDGVHRPTVAGIHGGPDGAYSIALSGGYEDDLDLGDCFTYTGEGGRDLKGTKAKPKNLRTAPQSKDQTLTRGNLALSRSVETKNPVRVIRGYKLSSQFAPEDGYRYDGIYTVEKFWFTTGLSGYGVFKFALKRCPDQAASPWTYVQNEDFSKEDCEDQTDLSQLSVLPDLTTSAISVADTRTPQTLKKTKKITDTKGSNGTAFITPEKEEPMNKTETCLKDGELKTCSNEDKSTLFERKPEEFSEENNNEAKPDENSELLPSANADDDEKNTESKNEESQPPLQAIESSGSFDAGKGDRTED